MIQRVENQGQLSTLLMVLLFFIISSFCHFFLKDITLESNAMKESVIAVCWALAASIKRAKMEVKKWKNWKKRKEFYLDCKKKFSGSCISQSCQSLFSRHFALMYLLYLHFWRLLEEIIQLECFFFLNDDTKLFSNMIQLLLFSNCFTQQLLKRELNFLATSAAFQYSMRVRIGPGS